MLFRSDALSEDEIKEKAAALKKACKKAPLLLSGATGKGVPETVRKLFQIVQDDRAAQRAAQVEAEKTPEEKEEGWTP